MSVKAIWQALSHADVAVDTPITSKRMQRVWWAINSLYESPAAVVTLGGSTQNIKAHNHSTDGGGCFVRGALTFVGRGDLPAHELLPNAKNQPLLLAGSFSPSVGGEYWVSPDISGPVRVRLVYSAKNSKFKLSLKESRAVGKSSKETTVELEQTYEKAETEVFAEVEFDVEAVGGVRNAHRLIITNDDYDPKEEPEFRIWSWEIHEDAQLTNPPQGFDTRNVQ